MKVLMSAYACQPDVGSEPGVGWNWAQQAALHGHEVHVITRANNRPAIEERLRVAPIRGLRFHYYDLPPPVPMWKKRGGNWGLLAYYYVWQFGVWKLARRLHRLHRFDITHHVTFVNDWLPSGVGWVGTPFIWGPVGGSTNVMPRGWSRSMPPSARRYEWARGAMQRVLRFADPFVALTRRRADLILTFTHEAREGIPARYRAKARAVVHIGISPCETKEPSRERRNGPNFTIVSGGRLVHWKGFDLLIEAFARYIRSSDGTARLLITGDGPFRPHLETLIRTLGVGDTVDLLGHRANRADIYRILLSADLYALPTLRDGPPVAILEAMLAGRPILCLDRAATAEMVPTGAGFKIGVRNRSQVIQDIAHALAWADAHPDELLRMGQAAREHALVQHDWDRIGVTIDACYQEIAAERGNVPSGF